MNFFEKEMRTMFQNTPLIQEPKFCGRTMLGKLDSDLRVKLDFIATHTSGQYDALRLTIINRTEGEVDKGVFKFSDILGKYPRPGLTPIDYHMWDYQNRPEWYTPVTAAQKAAIANRVLDYVGMYQDQSASMSGNAGQAPKSNRSMEMKM